MGDAAAGSLLDELADEHQALDAVVAGLDAEAWDEPTPGGAWRVRDQIGHLAHYDEQGRWAATDPDGFAAALPAALADPTSFAAAAEELGRTLTGEALLAAWRERRAGLLAALASVPGGTRLPWYGPSMSVRSFATARLMETWAHGQDVVDAVGGVRPATDRLRHVCHLGVATYEWSFRNRGLEPPAPAGAIRVELVLPAGTPWTAGDEAAPGGRVSGPAEDFCLVATQRRNVADTALVVDGGAAEAWMANAQCFAGPPTSGPPPSPERRA